MRCWITPVALAITAFLVAGCNTIGPHAIRGGRSAYNDAIISTGNEQVLSLIVRHRYAENAQLLAVSSVTANMRVSARVGSEIGLGPDSNFAGNLVPLSTSVLVEENPTISYSPLDGERFIRELLSPLPLDLALLLIAADYEPIDIFAFLVDSVSTSKTAAIGEATGSDSIDVALFIGLLRELELHGSVRWNLEPDRESTLVLRWSDEGEPAAKALTAALRMEHPSERILRIRVLDPNTRSTQGDLVVRTRSIGDLVRLAGAAMNVPHEHVESGLARDIPIDPGVEGLITIRGSRTRPNKPYIAVQQHGQWYWIATTDLQTKRFFKLLTTLISVRLSDSVRGDSPKPILTIPTAR
ncbi:MAG: hypothetical protein AAGB51_01030 [Planctomycetota bacterium]